LPRPLKPKRNCPSPPRPTNAAAVIHGPSLLTEQDIYLFKEGTHSRLYEKLGSHAMTVEGRAGAHFAVWAPNVDQVHVMGDFNGWTPDSHPLAGRWDGSGIWEGFVPGAAKGTLYKYVLTAKQGRGRFEKGDPLAFYWELAPRTASRLWDPEYEWGDQEWMENRAAKNGLDSPMSIYEVHLGSWQRMPEEERRFLTYREIAPRLASYVQETGFTQVEFLPVMEHPFYGSWGYQTVGYFAPSSRQGTPQDFMFLVDYLHRRGIGVILDWVPSHFPVDPHGLASFDGTHLYEHADPRQGFHPDWKSAIFNFGRNEVRSFLLSSARFWLERYHADGLRVDAVASMLYLDYSRKEGGWVPNRFGGRENLEAIDFLRTMNKMVYAEFPGAQTIAEESTAWPMVSRPTYLGGLGFGLKWNMGWMHDVLDYFARDSLYRKFHQDKLTFGLWYAFHENFVLPFSHDEVVHGKGSLLGRMPGDDWQKFANLRLLLGFMYTHPGKKLLFMGAEFGQWAEWDHEKSLDWHLMAFASHKGIHDWVKDLNAVYAREPALFTGDFVPEGFQWVDFHDADASVVSFLRWPLGGGSPLLVVANFTPVPRQNYRVGVPSEGSWNEVLNSDAKEYGGSGQGNLGRIEAAPIPFYGLFDFTLSLTLPPLSILVLKPEQAGP
jgi:1,4-alpha-glucan branching enzyme